MCLTKLSGNLKDFYFCPYVESTTNPSTSNMNHLWAFFVAWSHKIIVIPPLQLSISWQNQASSTKMVCLLGISASRKWSLRNGSTSKTRTEASKRYQGVVPTTTFQPSMAGFICFHNHRPHPFTKIGWGLGFVLLLLGFPNCSLRFWIAFLSICSLMLTYRASWRIWGLQRDQGF